MYELIVLSLLMRGAAHGYVIAGVINDVIGPFAKASNGRIYPLLARLEADGLVTVHAEHESEGGRVARAFAITKSGRARFRELMLDTTSSPREYKEIFAFKVTALEHLAREDRVAILGQYVEFATAHVRHLDEQGRDLQAADYGIPEGDRARLAVVFAHLVEVWRREAAWGAQLLAAETPKARPKRR
jgi:DNA-binding PadR family transcriptional regulator